MDDELDIIVTGLELDQRQVEAGLVRVFGIELQQARKLLSTLPATAKRGAPRVVAERYVAALRSIGARVEARPAAGARLSSQGPSTNSSLPVPAPSILARARESRRVQRETERAIKRFRAAEGLEQPESEFVIDPWNPAIPRAPALPHDLARLPNAALPRFSDRPGYLVGDPLADGAEGGAARAHADAQLPPPPSSPAPGRSSAPPRRDSGLESVPPLAVGLAHKATASIRPGLSSLRDIPRVQRERVRVRWRALWPALVAAVLVGAAALYWSGTLDSRARRHERAWRAQGIDAGESAEALPWIDAPNHEVRGLGKLALRELIERVLRAGARGVYVIELEPTSQGQRAGGLLIELPQDENARRTLFWQLAKVPGQLPATQADHGQAYHVLSLR